MESDIVLTDVKDGVATLTLNRPDVHNAFDEHMIAVLSGKLDALRAENDVFAIVLRGAGKSFSAGADMNWMKRVATYTVEQNQADAMALASMLHKLYTLPKTTIACVQGAAMGGGFGLAACCDIVIAQKDAVFALSEVRIGLIPATIAPYVLRALGERRSRRYFQTGEKFKGDTAHAIGFAHELASDDAEMNVKLKDILASLRQNGPEAMAEAKRLCLDFAGHPITPEVTAETARRIAKMRAGDEAREGLSAFLEKRKAEWVKECSEKS